MMHRGLAVALVLVLACSGGASAPTATVASTKPVATTLSVVQAPSTSVASRSAFTVQPTVQVLDVHGAPMAVAGMLIVASISSGGGSLVGGSSATTAANGLATFSDLGISGTVGVRTVQFAASGLAPATSGTTVTAGPAATIAVSAGDGQSANVGATVPIAPSVIIRDLDGNPVQGAAVTYTPTNGTVSGAVTSSNASGIAAVGGWTLSNAPGAQVLRASSSVGSVTFSATAVATTGALQIFATGIPAGEYVTGKMQPPTGNSSSILFQPPNSQTFAALTPGSYTLTWDTLAVLVTGTGTWDVYKAISASQTVAVVASAQPVLDTAAYTLRTGRIVLTPTGLPAGGIANGTVVGPAGFNAKTFAFATPGTQVVAGLPPGTYTVVWNTSTAGSPLATWRPTSPSVQVVVSASSTAVVVATTYVTP